MKPVITLACCLFFYFTVNGQNTGIGTNSPLKLLSVNGSLMLDQSNMNYGTLDSAGLRFGSNTLVGISCNRAVPANGNPDGLDFWTNGFRRMVLTSNGRLGIANLNPDYTLDVSGSARVSYLYTSGISSTASIFTDFDLNADDDLHVGDDATVMGNLGVGGAYDLGYRLRVNGNGLFTTNVGVDGNLRVDGKITNDGKGIVKSNTSTTLRQGFSSGTFSVALNAGQSTEVPFCITSFTGDNDNVRVMIGQFIPGSGASSTAGSVLFNVVGTQDTGGACSSSSTATVRMTNATNATINLGTNARLYLFTVVTD